MDMTYKIAHSAGMDAADRQMKAAGRTAWNEDDAQLAADVFGRLWPMDKDLPVQKMESAE